MEVSDPKTVDFRKYLSYAEKTVILVKIPNILDFADLSKYGKHKEFQHLFMCLPLEANYPCRKYQHALPKNVKYIAWILWNVMKPRNTLAITRIAALTSRQANTDISLSLTCNPTILQHLWFHYNTNKIAAEYTSGMIIS